MKLSTVFAATLAVVSNAQKKKVKKPDMAKFKAAKAEIALGNRSDGNALLIQQIIEFYLSTKNLDFTTAPKMISYGCWCQLLVNRKNGLGEPVDEFDAICKQYQQCSKCVNIDANKEGLTAGEGAECNWETSKYEILFDADSGRMGCNPDATGECGMKQCSCDEQLAFALVENFDLFKQKMSTQHGFEFDDECLPLPPPTGTGPNDGELTCCGDYPTRFPFKKSERRDCCGGNVFATKKQCCANDELKPAGDC